MSSCEWCISCYSSRQNGEAEIQQLISEMKAEEERHKRELETVRQQCRRQVEEAHMEGFSQCKTQFTCRGGKVE